MRPLRTALPTALALSVLACGGDAQQPADGPLVISSDPELGALAEALLPDLARRSGMELKEPVRLEKRSRAELVRYLEHKLDEELPAEEAEATVAAYALLGLISDTMDLRGVLLDLYTEQVAGFYEPDSTALFVLDDQPASALQSLLVHELVHAVQDQSADLEALTDPDLGNDRQTAAQAAIEGHATLVMLEYLTEQMRGAPVDLAEIPDFSESLRPALEGMRSQFPALAGAPTVIQEALLFPYLEGAGFVQSLWAEEDRPAPFGAFLPTSTEQVVEHDRSDPPVELELDVRGAEVRYSDVLGRLELGIFLETHTGGPMDDVAAGWGGDRYALLDTGDSAPALVWYTVWDDATARDGFVAAVGARFDALPAPASVEATVVDGRPAAVLTVGPVAGATVEAAVLPTGP